MWGEGGGRLACSRLTGRHNQNTVACCSSTPGDLRDHHHQHGVEGLGGRHPEDCLWGHRENHMPGRFPVSVSTSNLKGVLCFESVSVSTSSLKGVLYFESLSVPLLALFI